MDPEGVREAVLKEPFSPFTLRLADGRALFVPHREFIAVGTRRVVVIGEDDSISIVEPLLNVSIDRPGSKRNGHRRRSRA